MDGPGYVIKTTALGIPWGCSWPETEQGAERYRQQGHNERRYRQAGRGGADSARKYRQQRGFTANTTTANSRRDRQQPTAGRHRQQARSNRPAAVPPRARRYRQRDFFGFWRVPRKTKKVLGATAHLVGGTARFWRRCPLPPWRYRPRLAAPPPVAAIERLPANKCMWLTCPLVSPIVSYIVRHT